MHNQTWAGGAYTGGLYRHVMIYEGRGVRLRLAVCRDSQDCAGQSLTVSYLLCDLARCGCEKCVLEVSVGIWKQSRVALCLVHKASTLNVCLC